MITPDSQLANIRRQLVTAEALLSDQRERVRSKAVVEATSLANLKSFEESVAILRDTLTVLEDIERIIAPASQG